MIQKQKQKQNKLKTMLITLFFLFSMPCTAFASTTEETELFDEFLKDCDMENINKKVGFIDIGIDVDSSFDLAGFFNDIYISSLSEWEEKYFESSDESIVSYKVATCGICGEKIACYYTITGQSASFKEAWQETKEQLEEDGYTVLDYTYSGVPCPINGCKYKYYLMGDFSQKKDKTYTLKLSLWQSEVEQMLDNLTKEEIANGFSLSPYQIDAEFTVDEALSCAIVQTDILHNGNNYEEYTFNLPADIDGNTLYNVNLAINFDGKVYTNTYKIRQETMTIYDYNTIDYGKSTTQSNLFYFMNKDFTKKKLEKSGRDSGLITVGVNDTSPIYCTYSILDFWKLCQSEDYNILMENYENWKKYMETYTN